MFSASLPALFKHLLEWTRSVSHLSEGNASNEGPRIESKRGLWQGVASLTSAISKAPIIAHRAEVLEDKDSHCRDDKQHHKHHHPYVSTEWLWRGKETHAERLDTQQPPYPSFLCLPEHPNESVWQNGLGRNRSHGKAFNPNLNNILNW